MLRECLEDVRRADPDLETTGDFMTLKEDSTVLPMGKTVVAGND